MTAAPRPYAIATARPRGPAPRQGPPRHQPKAPGSPRGSRWSSSCPRRSDRAASRPHPGGCRTRHPSARPSCRTASAGRERPRPCQPCRHSPGRGWSAPPPSWTCATGVWAHERLHPADLPRRAPAARTAREHQPRDGDSRNLLRQRTHCCSVPALPPGSVKAAESIEPRTGTSVTVSCSCGIRQPIDWSILAPLVPSSTEAHVDLLVRDDDRRIQLLAIEIDGREHSRSLGARKLPQPWHPLGPPSSTCTP
jgi:hypothetical protein